VTHLGMENEHKIGAIGKPSLIWDVRIVDEAGKDVRNEEVGEIIVKGSGVMKEYFRIPLPQQRRSATGGSIPAIWQEG